MVRAEALLSCQVTKADQLDCMEGVVCARRAAATCEDGRRDDEQCTKQGRHSGITVQNSLQYSIHHACTISPHAVVSGTTLSSPIDLSGFGSISAPKPPAFAFRF